MENNNIVRAIPIMSPSGVLVRPRITVSRMGDKVITEATWVDPASGMVFKKGIVEVRKDK